MKASSATAGGQDRRGCQSSRRRGACRRANPAVQIAASADFAQLRFRLSSCPALCRASCAEGAAQTAKTHKPTQQLCPTYVHSHKTLARSITVSNANRNVGCQPGIRLLSIAHATQAPTIDTAHQLRLVGPVCHDSLARMVSAPARMSRSTFSRKALQAMAMLASASPVEKQRTPRMPALRTVPP